MYITYCEVIDCIYSTCYLQQTNLILILMAGTAFMQGWQLLQKCNFRTENSHGRCCHFFSQLHFVALVSHWSLSPKPNHQMPALISSFLMVVEGVKNLAVIGVSTHCLLLGAVVYRVDALFEVFWALFIVFSFALRLGWEACLLCQAFPPGFHAFLCEGRELFMD